MAMRTCLIHANRVKQNIVIAKPPEQKEKEAEERYIGIELNLQLFPTETATSS